MNQKKLSLVLLIVYLMTFLPVSTVHGINYTWKVGDKYTWESYVGKSWSYDNSTHTWDDYSSFNLHEVNVEILDVYIEAKSLLLEESWYYLGMDEPFTTQEVDDSFDLSYDLINKDINSLFSFEYQYIESENDIYFRGLVNFLVSNPIPVMYFCSANWQAINSQIQSLFNDTVIIDTVNGTEITFRNFLDNCTFTIMGENNYYAGLNQMTPTNHHWFAEFDYSALVEIRGSNITSSVVEEAIATFDLQYSEGGVLENYLIRISVIIQTNNFIYYLFDIHEYVLTDSGTVNELLMIIIPTVIVGIIVVIVVILVINMSKKRRV